MGDAVDDANRIVNATNRYEAAMHAVQTGIAYSMEKDPKSTSPKHLRVGVDSAMATHKALAVLLMDKGIFTEVEYVEALAQAAEEERDFYQELIDRLYGNGITKITLL